MAGAENANEFLLSSAARSFCVALFLAKFLPNALLSGRNRYLCTKLTGKIV
jgi:hypothetical protein